MKNEHIKTEFESLRSGALDIVHNAKRENRTMTTEEKREVDEKFNKAETLREANKAIEDVHNDAIKQIVTRLCLTTAF